MTTTLPPEDRIAIADLLTKLCRAVDDRAPDRLDALLAEDVSFDLGHGALDGREQVVTAFRKRAEDTSFVARHCWSNLLIDEVDGDDVRLTYVFFTFAHLGSGDDLKPVWRAGDCRDVVRRKDDGRWVLKARKLTVLMP